METVEIDANVKIEVPWEDDVLCNEIVANDVKVKSEPVDNSVDDGENQDPKHEIIDITLRSLLNKLARLTILRKFSTLLALVFCIYFFNVLMLFSCFYGPI